MDNAAWITATMAGSVIKDEYFKDKMIWRLSTANENYLAGVDFVQKGDTITFNSLSFEAGQVGLAEA